MIATRPSNKLADATDYCVNWLKSQGLEVLSVKDGLVLPLVFVRNTALCSKFEGRAQAFERGPKGEQRYWFVTRFGCEVRWME